MRIERPESVEGLAALLAEAGAGRNAVRLTGAASKSAMAGPLAEAETEIRTTALRRVVEYDPRDLTVSVEAGLPFSELSGLLAEHGQMLPLDPPFCEHATAGGVVATNSSGPRRRLYGTARDMIIGMKFATLDGRLAKSGGMVVKNVAGLDISKMLVGSFGTLAAIAVVNFKVCPKPPATRTFALPHDSADAACAARDRLLGSVLQPAAVDLANPAAARLLGLEGFVLLVQAGGGTAVLNRYQSELPGALVFEGEREAALWEGVREFVPRFLSGQGSSVVLRISSTLGALKDVVSSTQAAAVARAGSGVGYLCFESVQAASQWMRETGDRPWKSVVEFAPAAGKSGLTLWPSPGSDFAMMEKVKEMFDPARLLNRGRLYGRI